MNDVFRNGSDIDDEENNIDIYFDRIKNRNIAVINENYYYRRDFRIGDVVTVDCEENFGYVYSILDNEVKVNWGAICEWEDKNNLIIIPVEYGAKCLSIAVSNNKQLFDYDVYITGWFRYINGFYSDASECLRIKQYEFNKVDFIKFESEKLVDMKFNRKIVLYRDFDFYSLYKTKLFKGDSFSSYENVFYILDKKNKNIYFAGIRDEVRSIMALLYSLK